LRGLFSFFGKFCLKQKDTDFSLVIIFVAPTLLVKSMSGRHWHIWLHSINSFS